VITPEDIYTFLVQSGARVTKYPDSFRVSQPGALISVEGYINLTDVAQRLNRHVAQSKPFRSSSDLQSELIVKQLEAQDLILAMIREKVYPAPKKGRKKK